MQYRVSGTIGDLVVDLVVDGVRGSGRAAGSAASEDVMLSIAKCREVLGEEVSGLADALVEALGGQTKRGFVSESRALREVWEPLVHAAGLDRYSLEGLAGGLRVALDRGKFSVAYAKGVARGEASRSVPAVSGGVLVSKYRTVQ